MAAELGFGQVAIDCENAVQLAGFWSELVGRPIDPGASEFYALVPASADRTFPALMFLQVPEPRTAKNRWHLDLTSTDPAAEAARAVELGAEQLGSFDEYGSEVDHPGRSRGQPVRHRSRPRLSGTPLEPEIHSGATPEHPSGPLIL